MSEQIGPLHISTLCHVNLLVNVAFKISLQGSERGDSKSIFVLDLIGVNGEDLHERIVPRDDDGVGVEERLGIEIRWIRYSLLQLREPSFEYLSGVAIIMALIHLTYENSVYCETFHLEESGWRECKLCGKRIHCGCIASKSLHDYLDLGGVGCISCAKSLETHLVRPIQDLTFMALVLVLMQNSYMNLVIEVDKTVMGFKRMDIPNGFGLLTANKNSDPQSSFVENRMSGISSDKQKLMKLSKAKDAKELNHFPQPRKSESNACNGKIKREAIMLSTGEVGTGFPGLIQLVGPSISAKPENSRQKFGLTDMCELLAQPSLSFSLSTPLDTPNSLVPPPGDVVEGREQNKIPPFQQGQRKRHILPKPTKIGLTIGSEENNISVSQTRVARPPAEGRGRTQLLPRYWPRITDQELQQISGDLNSTIVPLFEKVLSASDAGRIGRLVLPKACAEAYFPPISQSEGVPIRIQDIKGKEWTFQFRFWPNNNSRMYVLEGVTPCIQNMQLQAGDTVIFSRIDPGGKLVMGFRKASNSVDMQDNQTSSHANGASSGETSTSGVNDNLPTHGDRTNEDLSQRPMLVPEKKRSRNIGSKCKRLLMHSEDAMALRLTWAEAQGLLRPPPSVKPTVVMVEDQEFEEYEASKSSWQAILEPPVFGKRTIFTARASGDQEQWAQCDNCSKWRRLPMDVLLPPKWTCLNNIWDSSRCSCSAPDEINLKELESLLRVGKESKKRRITERRNVPQEHEPSGLDALATAAVLGADAGGPRRPIRGTHYQTSPTPSRLHLHCKGQLDLNCDPNREDDVLGLMSLVHAANLPLEMYLRQNGIADLGPCLLSQAMGEIESRWPEGCASSSIVERENHGDERQIAHSVAGIPIPASYAATGILHSASSFYPGRRQPRHPAPSAPVEHESPAAPQRAPHDRVQSQGADQRAQKRRQDYHHVAVLLSKFASLPSYDPAPPAAGGRAASLVASRWRCSLSMANLSSPLNFRLLYFFSRLTNGFLVWIN
ncbi:B3 domain-containing transcription repressor VAL1 [Actinidia rufa]|uniref:B3 domain-containing transcription repressor VAL1 n=1 Tax=Actinidia rufa TaxID=165716 RepID=A0A7J0GRG8_9ERIC|nr:B3 domain-containing transcription repressor VAL1 [Actinidia rufa]